MADGAGVRRCCTLVSMQTPCCMWVLCMALGLSCLEWLQGVDAGRVCCSVPSLLQDQQRMYGGLLALRILTRKYEFRDDVSTQAAGSSSSSSSGRPQQQWAAAAWLVRPSTGAAAAEQQRQSSSSRRPQPGWAV